MPRKLPQRIFGHWAFKLFVVMLNFSLLAFLGFEMWAGPHPECSYNAEDVGPCDYWGRVYWGYPLVVFAAAELFTIVAIVYGTLRWSKSRLAKK